MPLPITASVAICTNMVTRLRSCHPSSPLARMSIRCTRAVTQQQLQQQPPTAPQQLRECLALFSHASRHMTLHNKRRRVLLPPHHAVCSCTNMLQHCSTHIISHRRSSILHECLEVSHKGEEADQAHASGPGLGSWPVSIIILQVQGPACAAVYHRARRTQPKHQPKRGHQTTATTDEQRRLQHHGTMGSERHCRQRVREGRLG